MGRCGVIRTRNGGIWSGLLASSRELAANPAPQIMASGGEDAPDKENDDILE